MSDAPTATNLRVERTFAFIDLSGFTRFTDTEGDGRATEELKRFREAVRDAASSRGVRIAKWLGDGAMLVGVESEPVVEAVVELEQRMRDAGFALPLRAGISTGPVILFEGDDYIGHAVNLASRLCDAAAPREILAPVTVLEGLSIEAVVEPVGLRKVRGVEEPVELVRLLDAG